MVNQLTRAQPPLEFIPPAFNPLVLQACQSLLPLWLNWQANISEIKGDRVEILVHLYEQFQQGKIRFLMAFRHPSIHDPLCMSYLLWKLVPQIARKEGVSLQFPIHAHFLYDRGIPLWAGSPVGWLASRLGGTSIQRGKLDIPGLRSARNLFLDSNLPMAAAPEGATNGHNELISSLEPGIPQLGFWCVEDLLKSKRSEDVIILPIGIQYHYLTPPWKSVENLLTKLEIDCGLSQENDKKLLNNSPENPDIELLYQRLYRLGEKLLSLMEEFYQEFYHQTLAPVSVPENPSDRNNSVLATRLQTLLNTALRVAEQYFNLPPKGSLTDRCRRLEQAGWDYIYREELKATNNNFCAIKIGLADRIAEEASLRMWHMRLVETFVAVTGNYVQEKPTAERFAETTLLLWDCVARLKGGNAFLRPQLGKQTVRISIGEPLSVSQRWGDYQTNRRQAVATLTQDLQVALESLIIASSL